MKLWFWQWHEIQSFWRLRTAQGSWVSAQAAGKMPQQPQCPFTTSQSELCWGSFLLLLPLSMYLQSQSLLIIKRRLISTLSVSGASGCMSALQPPILSDTPWIYSSSHNSFMAININIPLTWLHWDEQSKLSGFYFLGPGFLSWRHISMSWIFEVESIPVFQCKVLQANLLKCKTVCWVSPWALKLNRIEEKQWSPLDKRN